MKNYRVVQKAIQKQDFFSFFVKDGEYATTINKRLFIFFPPSSINGKISTSFAIPKDTTIIFDKIPQKLKNSSNSHLNDIFLEINILYEYLLANELATKKECVNIYINMLKMKNVNFFKRMYIKFFLLLK